MVVVAWTTPARNDLKRIFDYIAQDSRYYAHEIVMEIFRIVDVLPLFPQQGRIVPELRNHKIREIFIYSYRLIYKLGEGQVYILAILHMKQKMKKAKKQGNQDV